jgi:hypothetical protein
MHRYSSTRAYSIQCLTKADAIHVTTYLLSSVNPPLSLMIILAGTIHHRHLVTKKG